MAALAWWCETGGSVQAAFRLDGQDVLIEALARVLGPERVIFGGLLFWEVAFDKTLR